MTFAETVPALSALGSIVMILMASSWLKAMLKAALVR